MCLQDETAGMRQVDYASTGAVFDGRADDIPWELNQAINSVPG